MDLLFDGLLTLFAISGVALLLGIIRDAIAHIRGDD